MDLRDYFHRRCSELLVMEREVWQLHSVMAQESRRADLKGFFERHNGPKRQQISNLEQVVDELGGIIGALEHPVTQAFRRMHRQFMEINPPPALIDIHHALGANKLAHLEMAAYTEVIALARQLGEEQFTRMLEGNLRTEEEMRASLEGMLPEIISTGSDQLRRAA